MTAVSAKIACGKTGESDGAPRSLFRDEPLRDVREKHVAEVVAIEGAEEDERVSGQLARYR